MLRAIFGDGRVQARRFVLTHTHILSLARTHRSPCEWYRGYGHLRHLLNPIYFATSGTKLKNHNNNLHGSQPLPEQSEKTQQQQPVALPPIADPFTFPDRSKARILILGCGNSSFGADMLRDGWTGTVVNVDFSATVIAQMKSKYSPHFYQHLPVPVAVPMDFVCADMTRPLDFTDGAFDLIVCKGALDAVLCRSKGDALRVVEECHRLLAPGHGIFFVVTNGNPDNRLEYLEHQHSLAHYWRGVSVQMVPKREVDEK